MPLLLDVTSGLQLVNLTTNGAGATSLTLIMPSDPAVLGFPLSLQAVSVDPVVLRYRLRNLATVVATT